MHLNATVAAFEFLNQNLDKFTPWRPNGLSVQGMQALAELTLAQDVLASVPELVSHLEKAGCDVHSWERHTREQLRDPALRELPRKRPLCAFPYLLPYLIQRRRGWHEAYWEETVGWLMTQGLPYGAEALPYRRLDVAYFLNAAGLDPCIVGGSFPLGNPLQLYRETFAARERNPISVDVDAAYAITHTLFYLSDFGRVRPRLPDEDVDRLQALLVSLTLHAWRTGHLDLLAELLFCVRVVGSSDPIVAIAERYFDGVRAATGHVPATSERFEWLVNQSTKSEEVFATCYHTTLVALLLDAQRLRGTRS
ncbi:MAG: DUF6895 family protein [Candidatus Binatia bacterium]